MRYTFYFFILFASCSTVNEESRQIKRESRRLVKGGPVLYAIDRRKDSSYQIILRSDNSFTLLAFLNSGRKHDYYAGTFHKNNDSLIFTFLKDYRPEHLTNIALLKKSTNEVILIAKDTSKSNILGIVQSTLKE